MKLRAAAILVPGLLALLSGVAQAQRYRVEKHAGIQWIVGPKGEKIFSLGVCVVDTGIKFDSYDVKNTAYAAWRFYPSKPAWAQDAVKLLTDGGFNTIGAWSEYESLLQARNNKLYMTPIVHNGSSAGFPWLDMWDPALVKIADDVTKGLLTTLKGDSRILGYFSDNELGWWKPALFEWIWKQKTLNTRVRTVALLEKEYGGKWSSLLKDFEPVDAKSWTDLRKRGRLCLRPGSNGQVATTKVLAMLAERYYTLCGGLIKKYDPKALYLGDRYISNYYPEVAAQAGRFCDVISTNLNAEFLDGGYARFHLDSLVKLTHKPVMITEYYMCSKEGRSGNGNDHSGFPVVDTLHQRAQGFENTTKKLLANPNVVGAHWFQYYDEPQLGREDGENYNFGLVDVQNKPYRELLDRSKALNLVGLHSDAKSQESTRKTLPMVEQPAEDLAYWNSDLGFIPAAEAIPNGDLYANWNANALTLGLIWREERFVESYYKDGKVPDSERTTVEIAIPSRKTRILLRVGEKDAKILAGPAWRFSAMPGTTSKLVVHVPASALGGQALQPGTTVRFYVRICNESRAYQTTWNAAEILSN